MNALRPSLQALRAQAGARELGADAMARRQQGTHLPSVDLDVLRRQCRARLPGPDPVRRAADLPGQAVAPGLRLIEYPPVAIAMHSLQFDRAAGASIDPHRLLLVDTETTGLAGGTGTRAFVIGIGRLQARGWVLRQWLLESLAGEAAMLDALAQELSDHPILLSYNGKSYDLPLLRTRWRLARRADASRGLDHIDLLHAVRRRYRGRWPDCRLATIERGLLGVLREDDLPGSEAPVAFTTWLRTGDSSALLRVLEHNRQDLLSLALLARHLGNDSDLWPLCLGSTATGDRLRQTHPGAQSR